MPTIRKQLTTDDLNMAQISQWLNDNQLPEAGSFLAPGSVGASSIAPQVWTALTFAGSWSNFAGGYQPAQFGVDIAGFVHVRGLIKTTAAWSFGQLVATLPAAAFPANSETFLGFGADGSGTPDIFRFDVDTAGHILLQATVGTGTNTASVQYVSLSGITFQAA